MFFLFFKSSARQKKCSVLKNKTKQNKNFKKAHHKDLIL